MKKQPGLAIALMFSLAAAYGAVEDYRTGIDLNYLGCDAGLLFWKSDCGASPAPSRLLQQPSGNGAQNVIYAPAGCAPAACLRSEVALDAQGFYYWINGDGAVQRVQPGGTPQTIATTPNPASIPVNGQVAVASNFVFWVEQSGELYQYFRVYGVRTSGLTTPFLVMEDTAASGPVLELIAHNDGLLTLLTYNGSLFQLESIFMPFPPPAHVIWARTDLPTAGTLGTAVTVREARVYWAEASADRRTTVFRSAPITDPLNSIPHHSVTTPGTHRVDQLVVDAVNLYYQQLESGNASLYRKPLVLGTATELAGPLGYFATCMGTDERYVYWLKDAHTISRVAVGAAAVTRDIAATGLEVVQIVQDAGNSVPLVRGKPTLVRLFGYLAASSDGATQITLAPEALLFGEKDGVALPSSPISPEPPAPGQRRAITTSPGDRTNPGDGWTFPVPDDWTRRGSIRLRGVLNPRSVVRETDLSNNERVVDANFEARAPICVNIYPLWHRFGVTGGSYNPALDPMFERAQGLLPTSDLRVRFVGGSPMAELEACWDLPPWCDGPYELSSDDDDSWGILLKLRLRNIFGDSSCSAVTARTHTAVLFNTSDDRAFNGISSGDSLISMIDLGHAPGETNGVNLPASGVTFAHELGHNYSRSHVDCPVGDPSGIDTSYPYGCNLALSDRFIGYDPISRNWIRYFQAGDLMSYAHRLPSPKPRWTSDYTWNGIRNEIETVPGAKAALPKGGNPDAWLIAGQFNELTGLAQLLYALKLDAAAAARAALEAASGQCGKYLIVAYDLNGQWLGQTSACLWELHDGAPGRYVFTAQLSAVAQAAWIEFVSAQQPTVPLASLAAGLHAPTVTILTPRSGDVVLNRLRIAWKAEDPDGDTLHFTVRYSRDNGATWQVIADETPRTSVEFDTTGLAGGNGSCRIQVIASDGLHTAEAVSDVFTVATKPPQASISFETAKGRSGPLAVAFADVGDPLVVRGSGYDDEDGPLADTALNWFVATPGILWPLTGTGSRFNLRGYPPGEYSIFLTAVDSESNAGSAFATLTIAPKYIAEASEVMTLDGYGDDAGYVADRNPLELRYGSGDLAIVRMVRGGDRLFVCVSGLPIGLNSRQFVAICADVNHSGDMAPQASDLRFQVYLDGSVQTLHGDGSTFVADAAPLGLQARVSTADTTWTAELSIDLAQLGGWNGQANGLSIGHYHRDFSGDDTLWPLGGIWDVPGTWGACVLGPNPNDLTDADQDGMPDQWEMAMFGNTKRDGSGDFDHDGMSDLAEYIAGTDPRDPLSRLEVQLRPEPKGGYQLIWSSVPGRSYTVYRSTDLQHFVPVATALPAQGVSTSWVDPSAPASQVFYRVHVQYWR